MRLLVLGGTRFLGRHLVDAALAARHDVTIFTRGNTPSPWGARVEHRVGNRDPKIEPGLSVLADGEWDAAVDTCGYVPRVVRASAEALAGRVGRYAFVSTLSVYADASRPGLDESAALATLDDPATEDVQAHYGALKALCEDEIRAGFGERALIARPGLIVGPYDATDRFAYWVARFLRPKVLGDRGPEAIVPAPPERPLQWIDARDIARWTIAALERGLDGTYNLCSPSGRWTMGDLIAALAPRAQRMGSAVSPAWIDEAILIERDVTPWTGLPLWIPASDAESAGFMHFSAERAIATGVTLTPLEQTIDDVAAWLDTRNDPNAWRNVLGADKERELVRQR